MTLGAVIFDYGMVLTGPPDPKAHSELLRITGLPADKLDDLYWADRPAFDDGRLSGLAYWQQFARQAELALSHAEIAELIHWDARLWMTLNPAMFAWQNQLKARGLRTAILSNMGDTVLDAMKQEFDWLGRFDVLVWSYQLRMAKPDAKIYLHVLDQLGMQPAETLFIDDRQANIDAARALGIRALTFTSTEKLRQDLIAAGPDNQLPLP